MERQRPRGFESGRSPDLGEASTLLPDGDAAQPSPDFGEAPTLTPSVDDDGLVVLPMPDSGLAGQVTRAKVYGALFQQAAEPQTLGRYVVLDTLGEGGMGIVLRAFDRELDRPVALKVLHDHLGEQHTARLRREAQAMAKLSHPNVVQVYEVGEVEGRTFVAMELVKGKTPKQWIRQNPPPDWRACVNMFIQLGEGLAAAHDKGLVHRDFKPGNAIIDDEGRPRVLDFGLARRGDEADTTPSRLVERARTDQHQAIPLDRSLTKTGAVLGTPAYMPPKQMMGMEADARSDQFSFCVSLYEAVYGERPFKGSSMAALMVAVRSGEVDPAPKGSKVPAALRKMLLRGLAVEPEQRWRTMKELLEELRTLVAPPARRWVAGVGLGLAAIAAFMVWLQRGQLDDKDQQLDNQKVVITQSKEQLAKRVVELEQKDRRLTAELAARTGRQATMVAALEGRELEAVQVAVQAFEGLNPQAETLPSPVFDGLTYALAGIDHGIVLRGHEGRVVSVAVSPDGQHIATASKDTTVRVWDANTGAQVQTLEGHKGPVWAVAWSSDGRRIATACNDRKARIWDFTSGEHLDAFDHQGPVRGVAFSPDGQVLATISGTAAWLWHLDGDAVTVPLRGHTARVRSVAWSPDGTRLVTASEDHTVQVWDPQVWTRVQILEGHTDWILDVTVSPDGTRIATGSRDQTVRLWDATTGSALASLAHGEVVYGVAFSPDGAQLATGTFDDGVAQVWDVASGHRLGAYRHADAVVDVAFSPDGHQLVTASWDHTARSWNVDRSGALMALPHPRRVDAVAMSPDGTRMATGSGDGSVRVWDATSGAQLATLHGHRIDVLTVAYSPDGSRLATASWDGSVRLWDAETHAHRATLRGHTEPVRMVVFSADGRRVATASRDGTARVWDAATGEQQCSVSPGGPVTAVTFAPGGQRLVTLGADDNARVWSIATGEALSGLPHEGHVTALAFSADGTRLAVATRDHRVHVRQADSGDAVATFPGHTAAVRSMVFSPNGAALASASDDGTARVWDLATKTSYAVFPHKGPVQSIAWSLDGEHLATASGDERARLWALDLHPWLTWGCAVLDDRQAHSDATDEVCSSRTIELPPTAPATAEPVIATAEDIELPEVKTVHGVDLVLIPGGSFTMGSPRRERGRNGNEGPQHEVTLDSFYLARTEVTNAQYALYLQANPDATWRSISIGKDERFNQPDQPVVALTWHEAKAYCDWAGLVLPTEAQWEYAARAGTNTAHWFGNDAKDLDRFDWTLDNTAGGALAGRPHSVKTRGTSPFGLHDVHGNIKEWTLDAYGRYTTSPRPGDGLRHQPVGNAPRVVRLGGWDSPPRHARSADREYNSPGFRSSDLGFRPAQGIP